PRAPRAPRERGLRRDRGDDRDLPVVGRPYGAHQIYTIPGPTGLAVQTPLIPLRLGLGLGASLPERDPAPTRLGPAAAGVPGRGAWPIVVGCSLAIGCLRILVQNEGLVDTALGTGSGTIVQLSLVTVVLWWAAGKLHAHERALRETEAQVRRQANQL